MAVDSSRLCSRLFAAHSGMTDRGCGRCTASRRGSSRDGFAGRCPDALLCTCGEYISRLHPRPRAHTAHMRDTALGKAAAGRARRQPWYSRGMRYVGAVIRPPSEAASLIVQVTYGCSNNTCDFCGTYLDKPFAVRPFAEVVDDVIGLPVGVKQRTDGSSSPTATRWRSARAGCTRSSTCCAASCPTSSASAPTPTRATCSPSRSTSCAALRERGSRAPLPGPRVGRRRDARRHPQGHHRGASRSRAAGGHGRRHARSRSPPSSASPATSARSCTPRPPARPCRPSTRSTSACSP